MIVAVRLLPFSATAIVINASVLILILTFIFILSHRPGLRPRPRMDAVQASRPSIAARHGGARAAPRRRHRLTESTSTSETVPTFGRRRPASSILASTILLFRRASHERHFVRFSAARSFPPLRSRFSIEKNCTSLAISTICSCNKLFYSFISCSVRRGTYGGILQKCSYLGLIFFLKNFEHHFEFFSYSQSESTDCTHAILLSELSDAQETAI